MGVVGFGEETYMYLNGLKVDCTIKLKENIELRPARCSPAPEDVIMATSNTVDMGIAFIFLPLIKSQMYVTANGPKELAISSHNSLWDAILLGALLRCEVNCNLQADTPAESFCAETRLNIVNYGLRGLSSAGDRVLDKEESAWIEKNYCQARSLMKIPAFESAVHCLASYRWHGFPGARLAILWSGIEGLFGVESEVVFRLSLYAARFLEPDDAEARSLAFTKVKRLYKKRSAAVHGSEIKGDSRNAVEESVELLQNLILRCVACNELPCKEKLAP